MRMSDWSSDVCSSDLLEALRMKADEEEMRASRQHASEIHRNHALAAAAFADLGAAPRRSQGFPARAVSEHVGNLRHQRQFRRNLAHQIVSSVGKAHSKPQIIGAAHILCPGGSLPGI